MINNIMSIVQEFLQQNLDPQISPSLQSEIDNITLSFRRMVQQLQSPRELSVKQDVVKQQIQKVTQMMSSIHQFTSQMDKCSFQIDIQQLIELIIVDSEFDNEWIRMFIRSKERQIKQSLALRIRSSISDSKSVLQTYNLQRYIALLEQIQSLLKQGKQLNQTIVRDADTIKLSFSKALNIFDLRRIIIQNLSAYFTSIKQIIYKLNASFDKDLEKLAAKEKSSPDSPLKLLKEQSSSRIEKPLKRDDPPEFLLTHSQLSQSKIIEAPNNSYYPFSQTNQRFNKTFHLY